MSVIIAVSTREGNLKKLFKKKRMRMWTVRERIYLKGIAPHWGDTIMNYQNLRINIGRKKSSKK